MDQLATPSVPNLMPSVDVSAMLKSSATALEPFKLVNETAQAITDQTLREKQLEEQKKQHAQTLALQQERLAQDKLQSDQTNAYRQQTLNLAQQREQRMAQSDELNMQKSLLQMDIEKENLNLKKLEYTNKMVSYKNKEELNKFILENPEKATEYAEYMTKGDLDSINSDPTFSKLFANQLYENPQSFLTFIGNRKDKFEDGDRAINAFNAQADLFTNALTKSTALISEGKTMGEALVPAKDYLVDLVNSGQITAKDASTMLTHYATQVKATKKEDELDKSTYSVYDKETGQQIPLQGANGKLTDEEFRFYYGNPYYDLVQTSSGGKKLVAPKSEKISDMEAMGFTSNTNKKVYSKTPPWIQNQNIYSPEEEGMISPTVINNLVSQGKASYIRNNNNTPVVQQVQNYTPSYSNMLNINSLYTSDPQEALNQIRDEEEEE